MLEKCGTKKTVVQGLDCAASRMPSSHDTSLSWPHLLELFVELSGIKDVKMLREDKDWLEMTAGGFVNLLFWLNLGDGWKGGRRRSSLV